MDLLLGIVFCLPIFLVMVHYFSVTVTSLGSRITEGDLFKPGLPGSVDTHLHILILHIFLSVFWHYYIWQLSTGVCRTLLVNLVFKWSLGTNSQHTFMMSMDKRTVIGIHQRFILPLWWRFYFYKYKWFRYWEKNNYWDSLLLSNLKKELHNQNGWFCCIFNT